MDGSDSTAASGLETVNIEQNSEQKKSCGMKFNPQLKHSVCAWLFVVG
jgi:hypothetical protein